MSELTIVILTYNVAELLLDCIASIYKSKPKKANWQIIVVDNASSDNTSHLVKKNFPKVELIRSNKNLGFSAGNNMAIPKIKANYILFLNPDTIIEGNAIWETLKFLKSKPKAAAATCKVLLPTGQLDYSCHRGFPTPWNSFCYFTGLSKLFPSVKFFTGYTLTHMNLNRTHKVDCICGTFFLVKKEAAEQVGWWDTDYFWNGEDIEFCFNLRKLGWDIYYYPKAHIIHYKGSSSGLKKTAKSKVSKNTRIRAARSGIMAMRIFYSKHFIKDASWISRIITLSGIWLLEKIKLWKIQKEF